MNKAKADFQNKMREELIQRQKEIAAKNLQDGKAFLEANAKKEGVITTASGLQYKVLKSGSGPSPTLNSTVTTNYRGTLIDGREFDSSYKRGQPASFPVKGVIKGWTEALQLMKVGDKWELYIPSDLAYGASQRSELIQPNSTLVFELELLGIK
jgi:FKBP-type peptidyl-prolyl cis-trans isomerase FklB